MKKSNKKILYKKLAFGKILSTFVVLFMMVSAQTIFLRLIETKAKNLRK